MFSIILSLVFIDGFGKDFAKSLLAVGCLISHLQWHKIAEKNN